MSTEAELQRTIGRMESDIEGLKSQVAAMQRQVGEMHAVMMRAQGSWKALVGTAGFSAAITGLALKALTGMGILK